MCSKPIRVMRVMRVSYNYINIGGSGSPGKRARSATASSSRQPEVRVGNPSRFSIFSVTLLGSVLYAKWQTLLLHSDSNAFNVKIQVEERQIQMNSECNGVQNKKKLPVDMKILVEELMIHIQIYFAPADENSE